MRYAAGLLFIVIFVLATLYTHLGGAVQEIDRGIGYQFIQDLPPSFDDRTFRINPIKHGNGAISQGIAEAISGKSRYSEVEREELDAVLAEQGLQHTDIVDPDTRVPPGDFSSADTIVSGKVVKRQMWPLLYLLRVELQATDVQTAEVLFTKTYSASYEFPYPMPLLYTGAAVLGFILLSLLHGWISARRYTKSVSRAKQAKVDLLNLLAAVARTCLSLEHKLRDEGLHDEATRLTEFRSMVVDFRDDIVISPWDGSARKDYRRAANRFRRISSRVRKMSKVFKRIGVPSRTEGKECLEYIVKAESLLAEFKS